MPNFLANWWHGRLGGAREIAVEKPLADDDGIYSSEDEEENPEEMLEIRRRFRAAEAYMRLVANILDGKTALKLYGLYKVATVGKPNPSNRPSIFDQKARAKFLAWEREAQLTKMEAMRQYAGNLDAANVNFDPTGMSPNAGVGSLINRPAIAGVPNAAHVEWTQWKEALQVDDMETIKRMLAINPSLINKRERLSNMTAMHEAAESGSLEACTYFLSLRPSFFTELDTEGCQPLHLASMNGQEMVVDLLLEAGASPIIRNFNRESPIDIAINTDLKKILQERADQIANEDQSEESDYEEEEEDEEEEEEDDIDQ